MATKVKNEQNPLQGMFEEMLYPAHVSQKCGAKTRGTGEPCEKYAAYGYTRCRLHGGAPGSGRPPIHGRRSKKAQRQDKLVTLIRRLLNMYYDKPEPVEFVNVVYDTGGHTGVPRQGWCQAPSADDPEPAAAAGAVQGSGPLGS